LAILRNVEDKQFEGAIQDLLSALIHENKDGVKVELEIFHDSQDQALAGLIQKAKDLSLKPQDR